MLNIARNNLLGTTMDLNLVVIRTNDPKRLAEFYAFFDLQFTYHQHGNSPFHYGGYVGKVLLEIYPLAKNQEQPDLNLRLGFSIDDFESVIEKLKLNNITVSDPLKTEFGVTSIVVDPDGRKISLTKKDEQLL